MNDLRLLPPAKPGEDTMTLGEAKLKRTPGFRDRACRAYGYAEDKWYTWSTPYCCVNYCEEKDSKLLVTQAISCLPNETILFINNPKFNPETDKPEPHRRSLLNLVLSPELRQLLEKSPNNITVREILKAETRIVLPNDCDTLEKIKEWVELNYPTDAQLKLAARVPLVLRVSGTVEQTGTASYYKTANIRINHSILPDNIAVHLPKFMGKKSSVSDIEKYVIDELEYQIKRSAAYGPPALSELKTERTEIYEGAYSKDAIRNWIKNYLRSNIPAENWAEYGL